MYIIAIEKPAHELHAAARELDDAATALRAAADADEYHEAADALERGDELVRSAQKRISDEMARL